MWAIKVTWYKFISLETELERLKHNIGGSWFLLCIQLFSLCHPHKQTNKQSGPLKISPFDFADQTPTPTRFLKNCEEVGLFSELDCSIEQEFCKAQEEEDSKQVVQRRERSLRLKTNNVQPEATATHTGQVTW